MRHRGQVKRPHAWLCPRVRGWESHILVERASREVPRAQEEGGLSLLLAVWLHDFNALPLWLVSQSQFPPRGLHPARSRRESVLFPTGLQIPKFAPGIVSPFKGPMT